MKLASSILIFISFFAFSVSASADIEKALAAIEADDFETALREFKPLAEAGNARAQRNLGHMYAKGEGVTQDFKEAVKWYTRAAEQGDAYAQNNLGVMYDNGEGVTQDFKEAVRWYRRRTSLCS